MFHHMLIGVVLALLGATCSGVFSSFRKVPSVLATNIRPAIFNLYFVFGVILVSILCYIICLVGNRSVTFTYLGFISGTLLVVSSYFALIAIPRIGVALVACVQSPVACAVSIFLTVIIGEPIRYWILTISGVVILSLGAVGVATIPEIVSFFASRFGVTLVPFQSPTKVHSSNVSLNAIDMSRIASTDETPLLGFATDDDTLVTIGPIMGDNDVPTMGVTTTVRDTSMCDRCVGIIAAFVSGVGLGSITFPTLLTDDPSQKGIAFFPSFAVGCLSVIPLTFIALSIQSPQNTDDQWRIADFIILLRQLFFQSENIKVWYWRECLFAGVSCGVIFNLGNVADVYSVEWIDYCVNVSLGMTDVVIASCIGAYVLGEMHNKWEIRSLFFFNAMVIGGAFAILFGVYGI